MPGHGADRGHPGRPGPADPARAPRLRRRGRCSGSACRRCPTTRRPATGVLGWLHSVARSHVEVALGTPGPADRQRARPAAARRHRAGARARACWWPRWPAGPTTRAATSTRGVDIVVAQGYEAGGHTGEIASMVLVPEVVDAVGDRVPVLAAGGIGSRPADRRGAGAGRGRRVDGLVLARHRGVPRSVRRAGAARGAARRPARPDTVRSRIYYRQAGPAAARTGGPRRGRSPSARSRCRCRCRTCWSARRTSG